MIAIEFHIQRKIPLVKLIESVSQWLIYIAGDVLEYGPGLEFLSCIEIGSRDVSPSLYNVNMFYVVQCNPLGLESEFESESVSSNVNEPQEYP